MILSLFSRRKSAVAPPPAAPKVPAGLRVYAVGDVHGRDDLLDELLSIISADHGNRSDAQLLIIFLGDLVDRGPDSRGAIDRAIALSRSGTDARFISGNHEEVFLLALEGDREAMKLFCRIGGRETALSYGVTEAEYEASDYGQLSHLLKLRVPDEHIAFLKQMEDVVELGDYAFVHAGIKPGVSLADQKVADLRWIRSQFLSYDQAHECVIVHGHSITRTVDVRANRIGIDTGAYHSGRLTALALEGDQRWFIATDPGD